jgi:hypothetical protein
MPRGKVPGPMCQLRRPVLVMDGTMCLSPSPLPSPVGTLAAHNSVASWSLSSKLLEAAERAGPKLPDESRDQFAALFSPVNIGITAAVFGAWGASHLFGVGEAADVVLGVAAILTIGWQAIGAADDIMCFFSTAARATTMDDLDRASVYLAHAVVIIGVAAFIALIVKAGSRLGIRARLSGRAATAGGEVLVPPVSERGPWWRAYDFGDDWPGTSVPRGFVMEIGGAKFRVTVNATEHMAEYAGRSPSVGQLRNPGVWSTSPSARFAEVDYPLSSLAGALEQAALKYRGLPPQRFPLERFGNWELGIDTRETPWVVEHALPKWK